MADTALNQQFGKAPKKRVLYGDKTKRAESAEHIIEFPGGAVEVARLEDGSYWAHIIVSGDVVDSRVDWTERRLEDIPGLPDQASLTQIAVLIQARKKINAPPVQPDASPAAGEQLSFAPALSTADTLMGASNG